MSTAQDAFDAAARAPGGAPLALWEDGLRALVQQHLERGVLTLSDLVPSMLVEGGPLCALTEGLLSLPDGTQMRFRGSLEVVE